MLSIKIIPWTHPTTNSRIDTDYDATEVIFDRIIIQNIKMAEYENKSRIPNIFSTNNKLWLSTTNLSIKGGTGIRKLLHKFCDQVKVRKQINEVRFNLDLSYLMKLIWIYDALYWKFLQRCIPGIAN